MTTVDLEEWDRQRVIIHEAGHALVAEHFGCFGWANVFRCGDPSEDTRSWVGKCSHRRTSPLRTAAIAFGGLVAEMAFEDRKAVIAADSRMDAGDLAWTVLDSVQEAPGEHSESDLAAMRGCSQGFRAAKVASGIVLRKWGRLLEIAEMLRRFEFHPYPLPAAAELGTQTLPMPKAG